MKIIAAIEDPSVIAKILAHLGMPTRAPPRAPARSFALFETALFHTETPIQLSARADDPQWLPLARHPKMRHIYGYGRRS